MGRTAAAHGERHVRSGRDSAWRGVSGEHSDRRTAVSFRAYAAERTAVPHVAADADDVPRRWGRQTYTRPVALVCWPAAAPERPNAILQSRMASGSQRHARAAKFFMKRPRSVIPPALNNSDTHITCALGASAAAS